MFRLIKLFSPAVWVVVIVFLDLDVHAQVPDYVPADGLVAAFGMNNEVQSVIAPFYTATNADSLSYSVDRNGNAAGAFYPNGSESAKGACLAADSSIDSIESLTVSFWVKLDSNVQGDRDHFIEKRNADAGLIHFILSQGDEGLYAYFGSNNDSLHATQILLPVGVWTHVAWTYWADSEASTSTIFTNGGSSDNDTQLFSGVLSSTNEDTFRVGGGLHPTYTVSGSMDELYIWSRALDADEIVELYLEGAELQTGCTDEVACNYDSNANFDDGSCEYLSCILGCTTPAACNFNPLSQFEDGSCTYAEEGYDCDGICLNDTDDDGICDEYEEASCDLPIANLIANATEVCQGGSVLFIQEALGVDYAWNFGANDLYLPTSAGNVSFTFGNPGEYQVQSVISIPGLEDVCTDTTSIVVQVVPLPTVTVDIEYNWICQGAPVEIEASGAESYEWSSNAELIAGGQSGDSLSTFVMGSSVIGEVEGTNTLGELMCSASVGFEAFSFLVPGLTISGDEFICEGTEAFFQSEAENFGYSTGTSWLFNGSVADGLELNLTENHLPPGDYMVGAEVVLDPFPIWLQPDNECIGSDEFMFTVVGAGATVLDQDSNELFSCLNEAPWEFTPTPASGMVLGQITVDAIAASAEDWIGAFTSDAVCAGATQPIIQDGLAYISLVVYGDDALTNVVSEGMNEGEDFTLQFFDASANASYLYHEEDGQWLMSGWTNTNGTPLPDYDDPSREFAFSSIPYEPECGDPIACNYQVGGLDPNACEYPEAGVDCDGNCLVDEDNDNVCDGLDPCVGQLDACGVCNGPGEIYACGCTEIPEGDCDCDGNQLDECGVCGGTGIPDGDCDCDGSQLDALGDCGGSCASDSDNDGVCDDVDPCVGTPDACGVCNGPGAIYECGCADLPSSDCNCDGDQLDALGVCGGACAADSDSDGICDDVDPCVGQYDECGVCNGTGPVNGYDCDGNCLEDCDADGVCDDYEVSGCVYESACNFDSSATDDDGSCTYPSTGEDCSGNCLFDVDDDQICDQDEITGCQDDSACNYDATATDAGYCDYPETNYDCDGNCLNDADQDGICDEIETDGCTDSSACNYDSDATDDDASCTYATAGFDCEGDCLVDSDNDQICDQDEITGCQDDTACNYEATATDAGYCDYPESNYDCDGNCLNDSDNDGICDEFEVPGCIDSSACNYDSSATDDNASCTYATAGLDCNGDCLVDSDNDQICDQDEITGCQDDTACNYEATATDAGYCDYPESNYDCDGNCLNDSDQDGICDAFEVEGCTTPFACNFNAAATEANGTCTFAEAGYDCDGNCLIDLDNDGICDLTQTVGCLDSSACNYDATATDAGYCDYPETNYDCDGNCLNDSDQDGICDEFEVAGCTDSSACNYDSSATDNNASCTYAQAGFDCDGDCLVDSDNDQICDQNEVTGCQDDSACNYDATATDAGYCDYPETNYDCDGNCLNDSDQDGICDEFEVDGCTDSSACNYDSTATDDDASCTYATAGLDCNGNCLLDSDNDQICDQNEVTGCQDDSACNYDATATDAGYCDYPETNFDCDGNCLEGFEYLCETAIPGCTDSDACNYNGQATEDNGSCSFSASGYDCSGVCLNDLDQDGVCDEFEVSGCTDCDACNFNASATDNDGSCTIAISGYDCDGNCLLDSDNDQICDQNEVTGCLDVSACNYDSSATDAGYCDYPDEHYDCDGICLNDSDEDGICDEFEVAGCTDNSACNYNADSTDDDASCSYAQAGFDCDGNCLVDSDNDQICDQDEITGCQDTAACNYDATATDAGYCDYPETNYDCDGNCLNDANQDGICDENESIIEAIIDAAVDSALEEFLAAVAAGDYCGEGTIWVPEWNECIAVPSCFGDLDNDGNRGTEDLLQLLSVYGTGCPLEFGCTDPTAENYDPFAVYDNGSCIIPVVPCDNLESVNYAGVDYGLLTIGDDCWFDANLYSTEYANGDAIEVVNSSFNWYQAGADENPAAIEVVEDPEEGLFYGYFYNAFAVLDSRGLCPTDWHVASDEDWMALESHLGMDAAELEILGSRGTNQGEQLKATATHEPAWDGTDAIDFTAVPAGQRFNFGSFSGFGSKAVFWTNTTQGSSTMMSRLLETGSTQIERNSTGNGFGASVRCVKDE